MNVTTLNMATLDGNVIIKKGEGGGDVRINNQDKSVDITENGTTEVVADSGYTGLGKVTINTEVEGAKPKWTGHADAEGLRAIGWTDEDIAYYQATGVNWNEEDDELHKVSDDNKALYGVLTASNISSYKDRIVYLPKIDMSGVTSIYNTFKGCRSLTAIPLLDTSSVTNIYNMFEECYSLTSIPQLDTSNVKGMNNMFRNCYSLTSIPQLDTSRVTDMGHMFNGCRSLTTIPMLDTSRVTDMQSMFYNCSSLVTIPQLDTSRVTNMYNMFSNCSSLVTIPQLDTSKLKNNRSMFYGCYSLENSIEFTSTTITSSGGVHNSCYALKAAPFFNKIGESSFDSGDFGYCYSLQFAQIYGAKLNVYLTQSPLLSKSSLLYIINNEAATSAITIKLASYAYDKWATDPDIVAALANHPNISLAK